MRLLHIDSSILSDKSVSRMLSAEIVAAQRQRVRGLEVVYRDLALAPLEHISGLHLAAARSGEVEVPAALQHDVAQGAAALEEFLAADIVVIGAPMYNFSVPSQLKAWIDRIAVAGKTFKYGPDGAQGLAGGKKILIASSRGALYGADTPLAPLDHQETYLKAVFQFLGVTDITFVRAEGVAMGEHRSKSIETARAAIANLAALGI